MIVMHPELVHPRSGGSFFLAISAASGVITRKAPVALPGADPGVTNTSPTPSDEMPTLSRTVGRWLGIDASMCIITAYLSSSMKRWSSSLVSAIRFRCAFM